MKKYFFSVERNSNSWHVYVWAVTSHYEEDNEVIDAVTIEHEFDRMLGQLEPVIEQYGITNMASVEEMEIHLNCPQ